MEGVSHITPIPWSEGHSEAETHWLSHDANNLLAMSSCFNIHYCWSMISTKFKISSWRQLINKQPNRWTLHLCRVWSGKRFLTILDCNQHRLSQVILTWTSLLRSAGGVQDDSQLAQTEDLLSFLTYSKTKTQQHAWMKLMFSEGSLLAPCMSVWWS